MLIVLLGILIWFDKPFAVDHILIKLKNFGIHRRYVYVGTCDSKLKYLIHKNPNPLLRIYIIPCETLY
jgi:hypothetical protein